MNKSESASKAISSIDQLSISLDGYIKHAYSRPKDPKISTVGTLSEQIESKPRKSFSRKVIPYIFALSFPLVAYAFHISKYYSEFLLWLQPFLKRYGL